MRKNWLLISLLCLLAVFSACSRKQQIAHNDDDATDGAKPLLALSILPQAWFAQRIAGDRVQTMVLAGQGQNPHSYEPTPAQMQDLARAGVWVLSGVEFELSLLPKIKNIFSGLMIIDGTEGVNFRILEEYEGIQDDDHDEEYSIDRHTWLGREPSKILAAHIRDALVLLDVQGKDVYNENYTALIAEIDDEFNALKTELAPLRGSSVYVYHPSFGYFLDEFGIRQEALESGGKEPGPRELSRLIDKARKEKAAAIFVQAEFPVQAAKTVADSIGAQMLVLDPLSPDWLVNIRVMGDTLKKAAYNAKSKKAEQELWH